MALVLELDAFHYPGGPDLFQPVRLRLAAGESVALVGPSGSGKSSLVTLLAGLHPQPLGGRFRGRLESGSEVGYLGSDPDVFLTGFCTTVMEEVGWSLFGQGWSPEQVQERVEESTRELGLGDLLWRHPRQLSGGQRQMVALAAVWARRPRYLLLDEPASKLDPVARRRLQDTASRLAAEHAVGVLWATSSLGEVTWCETVWCLHGSAPITVAVESASLWTPREGPVPPWPLEWSRRWGMGEIAWTSVRPPAQGPLGSPAALPSAGQTAVVIRDLVYRPAGRESDLFQGFNWQIAQGECLGLSGVNGAGKTTLARLIRGLSRPGSGRIVLLGKEVGSQSASALAATVAYTFQESSSLFMRARVDSELMLSGELLGLQRDEAEERTREALDLFGLEPFAAVHPRELPATATGLLGVALSWYSRAPLQILDEPLARLDQPGRAILESALRRWRQAGTTVVLIAHDLDWLCTVCTRIAVIEEGRILAEGCATEVFARQPVRRAVGQPVALAESAAEGR